MSEGAQRRSIDEIIGSIRSIVDRDNARPARVASNDIDTDVDELTEPPASPIHPVAFAEPVAPRLIDGDATDLPPFAHAARVDAADQARMAEIARTVSNHIPDVEPEDHYVDDPDAELLPEPEPELMSDAAIGEAEPVGEVPVHERLRDLHHSVASEHTVSSRGVTVQAANDPAPNVAETIVPPVPLPDAFAAQIVPVIPTAAPGFAPQPGPVPTGELSELDEAVLRPIIREWLDDNLPPVVERLVREELQKAIRAKRD